MAKHDCACRVRSRSSVKVTELSVCNASAIAKQAQENLEVMLLLDFSLALTNCRCDKIGNHFNNIIDLDIILRSIKK